MGYVYLLVTAAAHILAALLIAGSAVGAIDFLRTAQDGDTLLKVAGSAVLLTVVARLSWRGYRRRIPVLEPVEALKFMGFAILALALLSVVVAGAGLALQGDPMGLTAVALAAPCLGLLYRYVRGTL